MTDNAKSEAPLVIRPHQPTPGPWAAVPSVPSEGVECWWIVGNRAAHNGEKEIGVVNGPQRGAQEANARLIAAAPDLLMALKQARTMLNAYGSPTDVCHIALMEDIDAALQFAATGTRITSGAEQPGTEGIVPNPSSGSIGRI